MEQVAAAVDSDSFRKLRAHKIDDTSLMLLEDNDLTEIGIAAKGPRMVILKIIENLKAFNHDQEENEPTQGAKQICRETFAADKKFNQDVLKPVLDKGYIPEQHHLNFLTRIACQFYEKRIQDGQPYPSTDEQEKLAADIVELFPQLQCTNERPQGAPNAWIFFWRNNGTKKAKHTGMVYNRIRNCIKELPSDMHKYQRPATSSDATFIPTELLNRAEILRTVDPVKCEKKKICAEMEKCFPLLNLMLKQKRSTTEIIQMFPHLQAYNGYVIHKSFMLLFPSSEANPDYKGVLSKCLLYSIDKFTQVEDEYIRGFLRMLHKMPIRGQRRKADGTSVTSEEQLASPFIRWIEPKNNVNADLVEHMSSIIMDQPHIACISQAFRTGPLFVVVNRQVFIGVPNAIVAIDILFKVFKVLGIRVPTHLGMMIDFLECALYKTLPHSSRLTVNKLVAAFREAAQAEDAANA